MEKNPMVYKYECNMKKKKKKKGIKRMILLIVELPANV